MTVMVRGAETTPVHAQPVPAAVTVAVMTAGPALLKVSDPVATPARLVVTVTGTAPPVKVTEAPETGRPLQVTTADTGVGCPTTTGPATGWTTTEQVDRGGTVTAFESSVTAAPRASSRPPRWPPWWR
ncbi:hypothetical protein AB0D83_13940 [Streptomyces decoyicus]|uniref:hypothetical protein n=1 Tax=Streptomyces decoyicus TaxID=249567 RepID=UPI0033F5B591